MIPVESVLVPAISLITLFSLLDAEGDRCPLAIQNGVARGVFSNESGLGSAPIAAAAAKTNEPGRARLDFHDRNLY